MQDALAVGVIDGVADLADVVERERQVEGSVARDDRFERLARHELHHDEEDVLLLLRRENCHDVRMIQGCEKTWFAQQFAEVDTLLVRNLERDLLVDPGIFGEVHGAEASAADRRQNLVLADDLVPKEHAGRV